MAIVRPENKAVLEGLRPGVQKVGLKGPNATDYDPDLASKAYDMMMNKQRWGKIWEQAKTTFTKKSIGPGRTQHNPFSPADWQAWQEFSDEGIKYNPIFEKYGRAALEASMGGQQMTLEHLIPQYPGLYNSYPKAKNIPLSFDPGAGNEGKVKKQLMLGAPLAAIGIDINPNLPLYQEPADIEKYSDNFGIYKGMPYLRPTIAEVVAHEGSHLVEAFEGIDEPGKPLVPLTNMFKKGSPEYQVYRNTVAGNFDFLFPEIANKPEMEKLEDMLYRYNTVEQRAFNNESRFYMDPGQRKRIGPHIGARVPAMDAIVWSDAYNRAKGFKWPPAPGVIAAGPPPGPTIAPMPGVPRLATEELGTGAFGNEEFRTDDWARSMGTLMPPAVKPIAPRYW